MESENFYLKRYSNSFSHELIRKKMMNLTTETSKNILLSEDKIIEGKYFEKYLEKEEFYKYQII